MKPTPSRLLAGLGRLALACLVTLTGCQRPTGDTPAVAATNPTAAAPAAATKESPVPTPPAPTKEHPAATETATFAAGCYWCVEAVFETVPGVLDVRSGFMGGKVANPSYELVCTGTTGHAEAVQITFDPKLVSYADLLDLLFRLHDPTTLNAQGADHGTQYRSAIFFHSPAQAAAAKAAIASAQKQFVAPIVTEVTPASTFYPADEDHQDYYRNNQNNQYCRLVIRPKLEKLQHGK